ncbi:MAG: cyclase family protein [Planctomycetota bacterium]
MELIDISPVVSARIAVWPGDRAFAHTEGLRLENGDTVTLGSIATTLHVGAHADSPAHYKPGGASIDKQPLDLYRAAAPPRGRRCLAGAGRAGARVRDLELGGRAGGARESTKRSPGGCSGRHGTHGGARLTPGWRSR